MVPGSIPGGGTFFTCPPELRRNAFAPKTEFYFSFSKKHTPMPTRITSRPATQAERLSHPRMSALNLFGTHEVPTHGAAEGRGEERQRERERERERERKREIASAKSFGGRGKAWVGDSSHPGRREIFRVKNSSL